MLMIVKWSCQRPPFLSLKHQRLWNFSFCSGELLVSCQHCSWTPPRSALLHSMSRTSSKHLTQGVIYLWKRIFYQRRKSDACQWGLHCHWLLSLCVWNNSCSGPAPISVSQFDACLSFESDRTFYNRINSLAVGVSYTQQSTKKKNIFNKKINLKYLLNLLCQQIKKAYRIIFKWETENVF